MSLFFELVRFELKKILCRKRTAIVLVLVMIIGALSVFGVLIGTYYYSDENGAEVAVSRYEEEMIERRNGEALSGRIIDADLIMEAVEAYKNVPLEGGDYTGTSEYRNHARKYSEIYGIVRITLHLSGVEEFQNLTREQAEQFDAVRHQNMEQEMMNGAGSENVRRYRQKCLNNSPATLTYEYWGGYYRFVTIMFTTAIMAGAAIAVMISGIFSDEYTSGADSLVLSSKHGKGLVIGAKLFTAFSLSAALIVFLSVISLIESFIVWGTNGADGSLELVVGVVFPYPITIGQAVLFYFICMLAGCVMFAAITALFSSKLKLPFNTIVVMIALLIIPLFIAVPEGAPAWVSCLINLLPIGMFTFWYVMLEFQYEILGLVIPPYIFLPVFALIVTCICSYFAGRGFKRHQIN